MCIWRFNINSDVIKYHTIVVYRYIVGTCLYFIAICYCFDKDKGIRNQSRWLLHEYFESNLHGAKSESFCYWNDIASCHSKSDLPETNYYVRNIIVFNRGLKYYALCAYARMSFVVSWLSLFRSVRVSVHVLWRCGRSLCACRAYDTIQYFHHTRTLS